MISNKKIKKERLKVILIKILTKIPTEATMLLETIAPSKIRIIISIPKIALSTIAIIQHI